MRDWTEPEMSMSAGGYVSGSDGYGISEPLQYYDVLVDPLAYPFQEPEFQGLPYGQPHYNPTNLHFSMFGPQGPPSCNPPYPYRPYSPLGQELPCEPDSESPVPGRAGAPGGGLPLMKRPRLGPGARVRGQDELCVVCGDKASGYHYNALTCEGCKGFFRRSVTKKAVYRCKSGGGCEMDMYMRRKCQDCRLRKCRAVGMLAECLLTEVQCQSKRLRKGAKPRGDPGYGGRPEDEDGTESRSVTSTSRLPGRVSSSLSREQKCVLNRIVDAYRCCRAHHPAYSRVPEWSDFEEGGGRLGEMFSPHMERLQQFSKSIPGFELLDYADQNTLLSSSIIEILFLLSAQRFSENPSAFSAALYPISVNHSSPDWLKAEESQNGGNEILTNSGVSEDVLRSVLNFFHSMAAIVVTEAEYALLVATALLCSDRPMLRAGGCVESLQELVLELLSRVCQTQSAAGGTHDPRRFARLLGRLTELRTLRHNHVTLIQQHPWEIQP